MPIFEYNTTTKPRPNQKFTKSYFDEILLKSSNDLASNSDDMQSRYPKNIQTALTHILSTGMVKDDKKIETYRKDFNNIYDFYHCGYIEYLYVAYMHDCGIEIAPWYLWNIVLHQLAQIVKNNCEQFRSIFTSSEEKINIGMTTFEFDVGIFVNEVRKMIPDPKTYEKFFPNFDSEKLPKYYLESLQGLFADMVQKYYGAFILGCSCPKVRVLGDQNDWNILFNAVSGVNELFKSFDNSEMNQYLDKCVVYTEQLRDNWNNQDTWEKFFYIDHCGSGHQESVEGNFRRLLNYDESNEMLSNQIPNLVSRFPFEMCISGMESQKDSYFLAGVIGSNLDDNGILVPNYDYAISYLDKSKLQLTDKAKQEYNEFLETISRLKRLTYSTLKHHFTYNHKSIDEEKLSSDAMTIEESKMSDDEYNTMVEQFIEQYIKNSMTEFSLMSPNWDHWAIYYRKRMERKRRNGTIDEYRNKLELERLAQVEKKSNIWFDKQIYLTNTTKFRDASDAILDLETYTKQYDEARKLYDVLADYEKFKKLCDQCKFYRKMFNVTINLEPFIICTLDIDVYKNYSQYLLDNEKYYVVEDFIATIKRFLLIESESMYRYQNRKMFDISLDLRNYLSKQFLEKFRFFESKKFIRQIKNIFFGKK